MVLANVTWTDRVEAVAAVFAAVGVVVTLGWNAFELRRQSRESARQNRIRLAQRALDLLTLDIELNRVAVEHKELAPYVAGAATPGHGDADRSRAIAYGSLFTDLADAVGWQIRVEQMSADGALAWRAYFTALEERAPIVRDAWLQYRSLYANETRWLFGETVSTPSLVRLGLDADHPEWSG